MLICIIEKKKTHLLQSEIQDERPHRDRMLSMMESILECEPFVPANIKCLRASSRSKKNAPDLNLSFGCSANQTMVSAPSSFDRRFPDKLRNSSI